MRPARAASRSRRPSRGAASAGRRPRRSPRTPPATGSKSTRCRGSRRAPTDCGRVRQSGRPGGRRGATNEPQRRQQNRVPDAPQRAQEAVTFARDRGFEREAVTDERAIMRDALRRGMGDLTYGQVRENFEQRHGSRRVSDRRRPEARDRAAVHHPRDHRRRTCRRRPYATRPEHRRADHERKSRLQLRRTPANFLNPASAESSRKC